MNLTCFKAYDIRGELGLEINDDIAYEIGRAFVQVFHAKKVVVGGDARLSSGGLKSSLSRGI